MSKPKKMTPFLIKLQAEKIAKKKEWDKEMDKFMDGLSKKNGQTNY